ncbi:MAG: hypothetical protein B7Z66_03060 [Chromatiales bacterium 21-64-14]|nr:MAG: hypothetical protein B7Z66_03060 [Chromatiales bacterium 21-64-14]HQU15689.1 hypothetical protein [Gammaproteobacteria bacterium]
MDHLDDAEVPEWDVALEALIREECEMLGRPLDLEDFQRLARDYDFRTHDFLATVCQLVSCGKWVHRLPGASAAGISETEVARLYVYGRIDEDLAQKYGVSWEPRSGPPPVTPSK